MENFLALRRGLLEHLELGRITSDQFAAFVYIAAKANHNNGTWKGCGETLARAMHWCRKKAQRVIASLATLGYLKIERIQHHYGSYRMRVDKYFGTRAQNDLVNQERAPKMTPIPQERGHKMPTLQEVRQEQYEERSRARKPRAIYPAHLGTGPRPQELGITINPAALQRIVERQRKAASA